MLPSSAVTESPMLSFVNVSVPVPTVNAALYKVNFKSWDWTAFQVELFWDLNNRIWKLLRCSVYPTLENQQWSIL